MGIFKHMYFSNITLGALEEAEVEFDNPISFGMVFVPFPK